MTQQCEHRERLPEDDSQASEVGSGAQCPKGAAYLSCVPYANTLTCIDHKCRCAKSITPKGPKRKDLTGQVFGNLTVQTFSHRSPTNYYYTCLCSCGNPCVASSKSLKIGNKRSCGCLRRRHAEALNKARRHPQPWAPEMKAYIYHLTVDRASRRHLASSWGLSLDEYIILSCSECFYCGREPSGKPTSKILRKAGILKSGIDRVDNLKGYTYSNCVSCCGPCNREKGALSACAFIEATWRRYHHLRNKGLLESEDIITKVGIHFPEGPFQLTRSSDDPEPLL